jgi:hypothetical protein
MTQAWLQQRIGTVELSRTEPVVAGSFIDFKITYDVLTSAISRCCGQGQSIVGAA